MCMALLQNTVRACGIGTRVRFCPLGEAENLLKTLLPCGRAAVFADEGAPLMRVRARLAAYRPVCCVVGKEPLSGLFSLPDEVRAVVALGRRSIFAARFFASLRGGFVLAVPLAASAEGLFEAALPKGYAQAGYPLRAPDIVLADETLLEARAEAVGFAALSALCAEDLALHALFAGGVSVRSCAVPCAPRPPCPPCARQRRRRTGTPSFRALRRGTRIFWSGRSRAGFSCPITRAGRCMRRRCTGNGPPRF